MLTLACFVTACAEMEPPAPTCTPDEAQWESEVRDIVSRRCGTCHGATPDNGAPFSLTDYSRLLVGRDGARVVDAMARVLFEGEMPPTGFPQPDIHDRDRIASWASCGGVRITDESGLGANRPVFRAPDDPPTGLTAVDVTASAEPVAVDDIDRYHEVDFRNLVDEDVFVRRISPIVDESRVLHHLVLGRLQTGDDPSETELRYLYTWAPGTGPIEFAGGGIRLRPSDELRLELHYNNGAGVEDVRDSSGVRLWTAPPEGREYDMVGPGPGAAGFSIPPRRDHAVEQTCTVAEDVRVVAAMPHMHEVGTGFEVDVRRRDGTVETVLQLERWSFETQLFYELPIDVAAGEEWTVRCHYFNAGDEDVVAGQATTDEMCFAFTYISPPVASFCERETEITPLVYTPGACVTAPLDATAVPTVPAMHVLTAEAPSFDASAGVPEGRWVIGTGFIEAASTFIRVATFQLAGQLNASASGIEVDAALHVVAPLEGSRNGMQNNFSFSGTLDDRDGPSTLTTTCPDSMAADGWEFGMVDGSPAARFALEDVAPGTYVWMLFNEAR